MNDRERLAHIEQAARNMEGEASMIARLAAELRGRVEEQADSPIAPDVPSARPGEGLGTEGSNPSPASPVKPCPDVPFGSLGNDVEETLDALLGFGRSARMVERAQLRNEIAGLLARRTSAPSPIPTRVKTNFVEHPLGIEVHEILSDGSSRFVVVVPSESLASNLAPSPVRKCAGCGNNLLHPDEVCCPPASAQGDEGESAIEEMIDTYGSCVGGEDLKQRARAELASIRAEVERLRAEGEKRLVLIQALEEREEMPRAGVDVEHVVREVRAAFDVWSDDSFDSARAVIEDTDLVPWIMYRVRSALAEKEEK